MLLVDFFQLLGYLRVHICHDQIGDLVFADEHLTWKFLILLLLLLKKTFRRDHLGLPQWTHVTLILPLVLTDLEKEVDYPHILHYIFGLLSVIVFLADLIEVIYS